jgi:hypothetical protein
LSFKKLGKLSLSGQNMGDEYSSSETRHRYVYHETDKKLYLWKPSARSLKLLRVKLSRSEAEKQIAKGSTASRLFA